MKHSTKLLLWIVGGGGALFVAAIVAAVIWASRGGMQPVLDADAAGKRLGALIDARACVDSAFARHGRGAGLSIMGSAAEHSFLAKCLNVSRPTAGLCDGVPSPHEFSREAAWASRLCHDRRFDDLFCPGLPQELAFYCSRKRAT